MSFSNCFLLEVSSLRCEMVFPNNAFLAASRLTLCQGIARPNGLYFRRNSSTFSSRIYDVLFPKNTGSPREAIDHVIAKERRQGNALEALHAACEHTVIPKDVKLPKITHRITEKALVISICSYDDCEKLTYAEKMVYIDHLKAVKLMKPFYLDRITGNVIMTASYHLAKGTCCGKGCRHCPYKLCDVAENLKSGRQWNGAFYMPKYDPYTTPSLSAIHLRTRLRCIDNSALGKQAMLSGRKPYVINVYKADMHKWQGSLNRHNRHGQLGDKVCVACMGEIVKGYIVGQKTHHKLTPTFVATTDTNNVVLLDAQGNPLGTRILLPIPMALRGKKGDFAKILAIATKFV